MPSKLEAAFTLHKAGKLVDAKRLYEARLIDHPNDFNVLFLLGLVAYHMLHLHEAEGYFAQAISLKLDMADFYLWHGRTLSDLGRLFEAIASYDNAIRLTPARAEMHFHLGAALQGLNRHEDAVASYDKAIILKSDYAEAFSNRGTAFQARYLHDDAMVSFNKAIDANPELPEAYLNRGTVFHVHGRFGDAVEDYESAIVLRPDYAQAYSNRGGALRSLQRLDAACGTYDQLIALKPDLGEAYGDRALCCLARNDLDQAMAGLRQAQTISPHYAEANWNLALIMLLKGSFRQGFELYEWRKKVKSPMGSRAFLKPLWLGAEPLDGKHILVHEEQGIGDVVQFSRYLRLLLDAGARVTFAVDARLARLIAAVEPAVEVVVIDDVTPDFACDFHCPLMSLPLAFKTDLTSIPAQILRFSGDMDLAKSLRARLSAPDGKRICGVSWVSRNIATGSLRSVRLIDLFSRIDASRYTFVNLQYGDCVEEIADLKRKTGIDVLSLPEIDNYGDLDGLAALIEACDLVVSIDNSTAHLAGALNKQTFVLLPYAPDWRWMMDRDDSPWHPSLRLFRQQALGDWDGVFTRLGKALTQESDAPSCGHPQGS